MCYFHITSPLVSTGTHRKWQRKILKTSFQILHQWDTVGNSLHLLVSIWMLWSVRYFPITSQRQVCLALLSTYNVRKSQKKLTNFSIKNGQEPTWKIERLNSHRIIKLVLCQTKKVVVLLKINFTSKTVNNTLANIIEYKHHKKCLNIKADKK